MTTENLPLRRVVACASGLLYWIGVWVQVQRIKKQIGRPPNVKPRGRKEKILWLGWFLVILVWIGQPFLVAASPPNPGLGFLASFLNPAELVAGLVLVVLGYIGTLWTYAVMGNSWRMGINAKEKTSLVTNGPFRWVRHPIYALQIMMLTGVALLLPTPLSLGALVVHYLCVRFKVADEERFLSHTHGAAYQEYLARTGGLIPRFIVGQAATDKNARSNS